MKHQLYAYRMNRQKLGKVNLKNNSRQHTHTWFFQAKPRRNFVLKIVVLRIVISESFWKITINKLVFSKVSDLSFAFISQRILHRFYCQVHKPNTFRDPGLKFQKGFNIFRWSCDADLVKIVGTYTTWKVSLFGVIVVRISPYSVRMRENTDQNNSAYGHFLRSDNYG